MRAASGVECPVRLGRSCFSLEFAAQLGWPWQGQVKDDRLESICCRTIYDAAFPFPHGDDNYDQACILDLVNQSIPRAFKFDLVAIWHSRELAGLNTRIIDSFGELLLELFAYAAVELPPFLERRFLEFEVIGHRGSPRRMALLVALGPAEQDPHHQDAP